MSLIPISASAISVYDLLIKPVLVVYDANDSAYNEYIRYAVENYWVVNTYEFISPQEFESAKKNTENIFLIKAENQTAKDQSTAVYEDVIQLVYFVKGGKLVTHVAGSPLINGNIDLRNSVINSLRMLQDKLQFIAFKEKTSNFTNYSKKVDSRTSIIKVKKLYIATEDIDSDLTLNEILSLYKGEIFLVSRDELNKLIDSKADDILYAIVFNRKTSNVSYINTKQIISADNGEVIYLDETTTIHPKGFNKRDLKNLAE